MSSPHFTHDLFISYAHIDNECFSGAQGWIDLLHERLEVRLAQLLGKRPKVWRDRKLKGYEVFDDTIVIALGESRILISIITPRYVQSDYCKSEIDNFFQLAQQQGGVQVGDRRRVFRIVKTWVPFDQHPADLKDLLPYEFYERNEASGRVSEFDYEIGGQGEKDKRYWSKFEDLCWDIHELIKFLEAPQQATAKSSGTTIYLAETTSDLAEQRDKVRRELTQFGHTVVPDKALPLEASAFQHAVSGYLENSRLSVHLIGEYFGIVPERAVHSVVQLQQELAIQRGDDANFSRLIWMPPGLQPKDEQQQRFVRDLQNNFTSNNGSELLQVKLEDLKTIIQTKLTERPKPTNDVKEGGPVRVYLLCDRQDADAAEPLRDALLTRGYETVLPLQEGTDAEILDDHKENLLLCDAILIFQGKASEGWLRMKLRELLKLPGYGRKVPLLDKTVYLGGPASPLKDKFMTLDAHIIRNYENFVPQSLEPFVSRLEKAKGGA